MPYIILKMIKDSGRGSAFFVWEREEYINDAENQLGNANIYKEVPNDAKPVMKIILKTLERIRGCLY